MNQELEFRTTGHKVEDLPNLSQHELETLLGIAENDIAEFDRQLDLYCAAIKYPHDFTMQSFMSKEWYTRTVKARTLISAFISEIMKENLKRLTAELAHSRSHTENFISSLFKK